MTPDPFVSADKAAAFIGIKRRQLPSPRAHGDARRVWQRGFVTDHTWR